MLSRPEDGWTIFQLGNETRYRLSYLTDVAVDWLTQAIHGLKTLDVFSVHGFSEPGRMVCTVSFWSCYIIFEDDGPAPICEGVQHVHVNMIDFCKKLYRDVDGALDAWVHWDDDSLECGDEAPSHGEPAASGPEEAVRAREKKLRGLLDELKRLIEENEENFDDGAFF